MDYIVYIVRFKAMLYTGQTSNLKRRLRGHEEWGDEAELLYSEPYPTRMEAVAREKQIKGWSRAKKEALIAGDGEALKALSRRGAKPPQNYKKWRLEAKLI